MFRVVTWIITVIIGAVPALCEYAPINPMLSSFINADVHPPVYPYDCPHASLTKLSPHLLLATVLCVVFIPSNASGLNRTEGIRGVSAVLGFTTHFGSPQT